MSRVVNVLSSVLMSGGWGGADCRVDRPDAAEAAEVTRFFRADDVGDTVPWFGG